MSTRTSTSSITLPTPANRTRRSASLTAKFLRNGQWHWIPACWLLRLSDFAREGMDNSGSYLFADHLYRNVASGRGWLGRWLDRRLLNLPATQAMRGRYLQAVTALRSAFAGHPAGEKFRVLTVPCGIPREVADFLNELPETEHARVEFAGLDIDPAVLAAARAHLAATPRVAKEFLQGNALDVSTWPSQKFHFISSTGLGEFLDDNELAKFYRHAFEALEPGGVFYTSATAFEPKSDRILRAMELHTHYRDSEEIGRLLAALPWREVSMEPHPSGLQVFVRATR